MAYMSPYIDETGLHVPTYEDIRDDLIEQMKTIFGDDIYIDIDSMDYQQISIFSRKIFDTFMLAQLVYNNRTPINAVGVGLDNDCIFANITRKPASYSNVILTVTGSPGTVIEKGQATDGQYFWNLPESVTIPENGTISVESTCDEIGNIGALPNTINKIVTPVYGWLSVTNTNAATPGIDIETDASLRGRFSRATRGASETVFEAIWAAIDQVDGVSRVIGYENDTGNNSGSDTPWIPPGLPPHSITFVIEGGQDVEIANAIFKKKTPGCYTNGTTAIELMSPMGNVNTIRFFRPTYAGIMVSIDIFKLQGWNQEYEQRIKDAVSLYVQQLDLCSDLYSGNIISAAMGPQGDANATAYSITGCALCLLSSTEWKVALDATYPTVFDLSSANVNINYKN